MHVLWTPSWYPSKTAPLNGSFFVEQRRMLENAGMFVGVLTVNARSAWNISPLMWESEVEGRVWHRDIPTIPWGIIPGDTAIIRSTARALSREYEQAYGIPEVIHAHSVFPGVLVAQELARIWDVPFGLTEHRPSSLTRHPKSFRYRAIRDAVHNSSFTLTVSTDMAQKLGRYYEVPTFGVQALPAPDIFFDQPLHRFPSTGFTFVHVSHMDRNKRVEETITAFARVHNDSPDTRLLLIGGSQERCNELRAFAASCGVADAVELAGNVQRDSIVAEMGRGDCLVLVSEREAGGTVFAEAQALGLPVIASATAAGKFMATPTTGELVPIDDPDALVSAMRSVLKRTVEGDLVPEKIRDFAYSRSSQEAFVREHSSVYAAALKEHDKR